MNVQHAFQASLKQLTHWSVTLFLLLSCPAALADSPGHSPPEEQTPPPDNCPGGNDGPDDQCETPECQQCPMEEDDDGEDEDDQSCPAGSAGDPVRVFNGEFLLNRAYLGQKDGVFPLALNLHYSSHTPRYSTAGWGWAHNFNMRIFETDEGRILLRDNLGKRQYFELDGGVYRSRSNRLDRLILNQDGSYTLTRERNGRTYSFDAEGKLTSIANGNEGEWRLTYTSAQQETVKVVAVRSNLETPTTVIRDWKVARVNEHQNGVVTGRHFEFAYDVATGLITSVSTQSGDTLTFTYDEDVPLGHGMLTQLVGPGNAVHTHSYDLDPERYRQNYGLMETFGNDRCSSCSIRTNFYDTSGRVIRQTQGENNEGEDITFNYSQVNAVNPYTEVTHRINLLLPNGSGGFFGQSIDTRRERIYFLVDPYTQGERIHQKIVQRGGSWDPFGAPVDDWVLSYDEFGETDGKVTLKTEPNGSTKTITRTYHPNMVLATKERVHDIGGGLTCTTTWIFDTQGRLTQKDEVQSDRPDETFTTEYAYWLDTELVRERRTKLGETEYLTEQRLYYNIGSGPTSAAEHTGLLARRTTPKGHYTTYTYTTCQFDGGGQVTRLGGLQASSQSYDSSGTLLAQTASSYDIRGLRTSHTSADGLTTTTTYDDRHRVLVETVTGNDGGLLIERHHRYEGPNLVEVREGTDAEGFRAMQYEYDSLNNRIKTLRYRKANNPLTLLASPDATASSNDWETQSEAVYDNQRWMRASLNALGQQTSYDYEPLGWQTEMTIPVTSGLNSVTSATFDRTGRETTRTNPRGALMSYTYDGLDRVVKESTQLAAGGDNYRETLYSYNAIGNNLQKAIYEGDSEAEGAVAFATTNYFYDLAGRQVGINWNPADNDQSGDLEFPQLFAYDLNSNVEGATDARGHQTRFEYDGLDRRVATIHPDPTPGDLTNNPRTLMFYDLRQNLSYRQDERGIRVFQGYDEFNRPTHTSIETNLDWTDGAWMGRPNDVRNEVTSYNAWSQPLTELNVDRVTTNAVYDSYGLVRETSGPGQPTVQVDYTLLDQISTRTLLAVGAIPQSSESWTYDSANGELLIQHTNRAGNLSTNRYGVDFQIEESIAPINSDTIGTANEVTTTTSYDSLGRPIATVDEADARQAVDYDVLDRGITRYDADHPFGVGGAINGTSEVGVQRTTYTRYGQVESIIGASTYPIRFGYDAEGNRIEMTDNKNSDQPGGAFANGATTRWDFDERDRVVRKRYAYESPTVFGDDYSYSYLPNNLLVNMTDGQGHFIQYSYEASRNLLLKIDYPADTDIVYGTEQQDGSVVTGYDKARRPTRFEDETGVCTMSYDSLGRPFEITQGNVAYEQVTEYDEWSRPILMRFRPTGANDGDSLEWTCVYSYDVAGRLKTLTDSNVSATPFTYDYHPEVNLITSLTYPNGMVSTRTWESRGLLSDLTTRDDQGAVLKSFQYGFNSLRQRETIDREDGTELTLSFGQQRQLLNGEKTVAGTTFPDYDYEFSYDEIGNRDSAISSTTNPVATTTVNYVANSENQYATIDSVTPAYDNNGSLLNNGRLQFEWQERNRLDRVTEISSGKSSHYRYDALGRRLEREDYDNTGALVKVTRFLFNGWNCIAEFESLSSGETSAFSRKRIYTWGLDNSGSLDGAGGVGGICSVVEEDDSSNPLFYINDGNGSIVAIYDINNSLRSSYEYGPYGELIFSQGNYSVINSILFSGKYRNSYIGGVDYFGYRFYDSSIGRWLSRDPLNNIDGFNLYGMVENDPLNRWDFLGLLGMGCEGKWSHFNIYPEVTGDFWLEWGSFDVSWYGIKAFKVCGNVNFGVSGQISCGQCCPNSRMRGKASFGPFPVCVEIEVPWTLPVTVGILVGAPVPGARVVGAAITAAFLARNGPKFYNGYKKVAAYRRAERRVEKYMENETAIATRLCRSGGS
ncbi:RHS repeat-associated core domain-containing protein [Roseibacillus persicicus]|uniref:RHS repeat-associated core domain-containing protein n=1 Tax=Roseibacillus persicicus TaxID=454148 RepID=UPI00398B7663